MINIPISTAAAIFKEAALLKVPEEILNPVFDWAVSSYCLLLLSNIKNIPPTKNNQQRLNIRYLTSLCNSKMKSGKSLSEEFIFPITYFPYIKAFFKELYHNTLIVDIRNIKFSVNFVNARSIKDNPLPAEPWQGLWYKEPDYTIFGDVHLGRMFIKRDIQGELKIYLNASEVSEIYGFFNAILFDIKSTVRHELQHMVQSYIQQAAHLYSQPAGVPSKRMREPGHDPQGFANSMQKSNRLPHELQDVEFYTNLTDNIELYKQVVPMVPLAFHKAFLLAWTGQQPFDQDVSWQDIRDILLHNNYQPSIDQISALYRAIKIANDAQMFFVQLKLFNKLKYKKALKEFYKAVS